MINCVIYEDSEKMQNTYKNVVNDFFKFLDQKTCFYIYNQYCDDLENKILNTKGEKIYILDIEVPGKSGLDLARSIRNSGDWNSPLIIITSYDYLKNTSFTSKMLMLDFISKKDDVATKLLETLSVINNIFNLKNTYTFQYKGELYNIKYMDILFFEKDLNDNYTFLYTKKGKYKIKESIIQIQNSLKDMKQFYKVQRSYIININNIVHFYLDKNILYFGEYTLNLISKESRDILLSILKYHQIKK